jgi:hypothetical protein
MICTPNGKRDRNSTKNFPTAKKACQDGCIVTRSYAARTLESWVRIPLELQMCFHILFIVLFRWRILRWADASYKDFYQISEKNNSLLLNRKDPEGSVHDDWGKTTVRIWDTSVGIALGYGLVYRGSRVRFSAGLGIFPFTTASRTALRPTHPPIQWVPGALSVGVKQPGREADHSLPSSAEIKNAWSYTSTLPIRLHGVVLS